MSGDEVRNIPQHDMQLVRNLIERCLQLNMDQKEVMDTLLYQAKIDPIFTQLALKQLEEAYPEFFKAYHFRLLLKNQIHIFNKLLKRQLELLQKIPLSNRSTSSTLQPQYYLSDLAPTPSRPNNNIYCNGASNGATSASQSTPHVLSTLHNSQMEMSNGMSGIDGISIKSEAISDCNFTFGGDNDNSLLDMQIFSGAEPLLDTEPSFFGFQNHIPRNPSFSDSSDDLMQRDDILENHATCSLLGHEMSKSLDSPGRDGRDGMLYTISEWPNHDILGGTDLKSIFKA